MADETEKNKEKIKDKELKKPSDSESDKKIQELTETLQRLQADFENFRKRSEKEKLEFREYAKIDTIERFLPILDNFELALKHVAKSDDFTEGIKLIFSQMVSGLEAMSVSRIQALGKSFDPCLHEALMADYSDKPKDIVIEEFQAGYMLRSSLGIRIIRHSKVKISKGAKDDSSKENYNQEECKKEAAKD